MIDRDNLQKDQINDELRDRALVDLLDGPVTPSNIVDIPALVIKLNGLIATAVVAWLSGEQYGSIVSGAQGKRASQLLSRCADAARAQARDLAGRVTQLGGAPEFDLALIRQRAHTNYREFAPANCTGMVAETLLGLRVVIQLYQEYVRWIGDRDPTSRRLLERILERNEADADELRSFLSDRSANLEI